MTTELVQVDTGEFIQTAARLTPAQAKQQANWLREIMKATLTEGVDYGIIPGVKSTKPTLWKSGAEMLILAAGYGSTMERVDDEASANHEGVTYRCVVKQGDQVKATCDGYAGYDEPNYNRNRPGWNTIIKMAQKRALVGAALNAVAGSGLFVADLDDIQPAAHQPAFDPITLMRPHLARLDTASRTQMTYWSQQNSMPPASQMSLEQVAAALVQIGHLAQLPPCETDSGSGSATPGEGSTGPEPSAGPSDDPEDLDDDDLGYWLAEGWTYHDGQWHAP